MQLFRRAHYRATRKHLESRTQLDEPAECVSGGETLLLYKILHSLFFPLVRVFVHCALRVEKIINIVLMRYLWNFSFFGQGDVLPTNSELCRFVSGSQAKHQVSSPIIILSKILSASAIAIMSWKDVTRSSLCSGAKQCGTKRAHSFLFPKSSFSIRRTTVLGMFKDSAIILYEIRLSFFTKSATAKMFTSVRVDFGQLLLPSSSTSSLSSRNQEYHLKTFDRFTAPFP